VAAKAPKRIPNVATLAAIMSFIRRFIWRFYQQKTAPESSIENFHASFFAE
jgi:hypothetical protein